ncbi:MAG: hydrogenase maturation nickel metallochaperone HypA [Clostridiales bacterium]|nr:hydrogenase maturation nickel metallochaperone HypA [Clostridiales bacterium]
MENKVKCPICGKEISGEQFFPCGYCGWGYTDWENLYEEDEFDDYNLTTRKKAKENLAKGLNIWGEPLPKR